MGTYAWNVLYSKIMTAKSRVMALRPAAQAAPSQAVQRNLATSPKGLVLVMKSLWNIQSARSRCTVCDTCCARVTFVSGIARAFPGVWLAHSEGQNEDKNEGSLRKNKKKWWKFEENVKSWALSHLGLWGWLCPWCLNADFCIMWDSL